MTNSRVHFSSRRALRVLGLGLGAAMLVTGGAAVVSGFKDPSSEVQRPDLLIAFGVGVVAWLGGASYEEDEALRGVPAETGLPDA